jgi:hypothetical protein
MQIKTFRTERGAKAFEQRVKALWANLETQICCSVGLDFRDHWFVECKHPSKYGKWIGVGPISRKAVRVHADDSTHGRANLTPAGNPR